MKRYSVIVLGIIITVIGNTAMGKSLLAPAKFPKTFNDLSFTDRVEVLRAGYEPWESKYDKSGRCISGCPYAGITIDDHMDMMTRQTNAAINQLHAAGIALPDTQYHPTTGAQDTAPDATDGNIQYKPYAPVISAMADAMSSRCMPNQPEIAADQKYPIGEPLLGRPRITSPFGKRTHPVNHTTHPHTGVDFAAPVGTDIFSPADGTVSAVWTDSSCGRGIRISHAGGYETVYCHLNEQLVLNGEKVLAGCRIGKTGNTGQTTGPHLHYGIKQDGTYINPSRFIGRE